MEQLSLVALQDFPEVQAGDALGDMLERSLKDNGLSLRSGDVLVIAQKIVSKAEGRYVALSSLEPSAKAEELAQRCDKDPRLVELILQQSQEVLRVVPGVIIVEHALGYVHANAGIDRSNIPSTEDEQVLLLPENPDRSAAQICAQLEARFDVPLAVVINDSVGRAWRNGTVGMAIGSAGFEPLMDLVGEADMYGKALEVTEIAVADELAAAASLLMGGAAEALPVVLVRGAQLSHKKCGSQALIRDKSRDLFR